MSMPLSLLARCHCGAVSLAFVPPLSPPINCHCGLCRRLGGSAFTTWLSLPRATLEVHSEVPLSRYQPTVHLERHFCPRCGTHVMTLDTRHPAIAGIPAGLVDDALVPAPAGDYFVSHKAPWHELPWHVHCFGGDSGFEPLPAPAPPAGPASAPITGSGPL